MKGLVPGIDCILGTAEEISFRRRVATGEGSTKSGVEIFSLSCRAGSTISFGRIHDTDLSARAFDVDGIGFDAFASIFTVTVRAGSAALVADANAPT